MAARQELFPDTIITGELLAHLQRAVDVERTELVGGRLYALPPNPVLHGLMLPRLCHLIREEHGWVGLAGRVGLWTQHRPDTVRAPDFVLLSRKQWQAVNPETWLTAAALVVEITMPSLVDEDIDQKTAEYVALGSQVWNIDIDARSLTVDVRAGRSVLCAGDSVTLPSGQVLPVADMFNVGLP